MKDHNGQEQTDLPHSDLDWSREERTGFPEAVFCAGKPLKYLEQILKTMRERGQRVLATRLLPETWEAIKAGFPLGVYHPVAKLLTLNQDLPSAAAYREGFAAVVSAGTSDAPAAEEAALVMEFYGLRVRRFNDAGVAGLHRLLNRIEEIRQAGVIIAVAGMEGALPSVITGQVKAPVIALPTSVGYGTGLGGYAALLAMLNSCASGAGVVNIDNGFGAACLACRIMQKPA
jgi:NCAIR mutase (PurE)-related protein